MTSNRPSANLPHPEELPAIMREGTVALKDGDLPRAAMLGELATRVAPTWGEGWLLLCTALTSMGSVDNERAMSDALQHIAVGDPARRLIEFDRARTLALRRRSGEAAEIALRLRQLPDISPAEHDILGSVFAHIGLYEESLPHCEFAAAHLPDNAMAQYNFATALRYVGRLTEAEAALERAIALNPDHSMAHATLASLKKWNANHNHVPRLRAALERAPAGGEAKARLHYSTFKELDDLGRTEEAWASLSNAAAAAAALYPFDREEKRLRTQALVETFTRERLQRSAASPQRAFNPIFIYGLPRSGTTLTERILASHSQVTAMGETTAFPQAMRGTTDSGGVRVLNAEALRRSIDTNWNDVAERYFRHTAYIARGARIVTEKLPHNYEFVGPIHLAFPDAPLVHVRRAPMDTLFGTFRLLFGAEAYTWSYALADLAENYRLYRQLMSHWRAALGDRIVEITLETLIDQPEREIRRLLAGCGLAFEAACLTPENAEGGVSTASSSQIRSPINNQGVGAWRKYAAQLEPLRAELERDGFVDRNGDPIWD